MPTSFLSFTPLAYAAGRYFWGTAPVTVRVRRSRASLTAA